MRNLPSKPMWNAIRHGALAVALGLAQVSVAMGADPVRAPNPAAQASTTGSESKPAAGEHPLMPAIRLAKASRRTMDGISDYESTFIKRELINGQLTTQTMQLKVREEPFSVYMKFQDPSPGREILFVRGKNQNQLLAHEATGLKSIVGTVSLAIDAPQVRAENRHAIIDMGMRRLVEQVVEQWELQAKYSESTVQYYPEAKIGGVTCPAIECSHPTARRQFPYQVTRLYLDAKSNLPVRLENYGFPTKPGQQAPLVEEYTYVKIKTNVGMKDVDFDDNNPGYRFH